MPVLSEQLTLSEKLLRTFVGVIALLALPTLLILGVLAGRFEGLRDAQAMEHAQVARHLARGEGFVTDLLRPLALSFQRDADAPPDLYNAPAHPLILATAFRLAGDSDKIVAVTGAALWLLTVWLTYVVARRWSGAGVALIATLLYGCNLVAVTAALGGAPHPLTTLCVLAAVALAFDPAPAANAATREPQWWRATLTGVFAASAILTEYVMLAFALTLAVWVVAHAPRKWLTLLWWTLGFVAVALPWFWRNGLVAGGWFGIFPYETLTNTASFPGDSIWRMASDVPTVAEFVLGHPLELVRKWLVGLLGFSSSWLHVLNPVVAFVALAGALVGDNRPARGKTRRLLARIIVSATVVAAASCLLKPDPTLLAAWSPLLAIAAAIAMADWIHINVKAFQAQTWFGWLTLRPQIPTGRSHLSHPWLLWFNHTAPRALLYLLVVGAAALPVAVFLSTRGAKLGTREPAWISELKHQTSAQALVMTDQPALVAWYGKRRALWLFQNEQDLRDFQQQVRPLDAALVNPSWLARLPDEQRPDWWQWLAAPAGQFEGLSPVPSQFTGAHFQLRLRSASPLSSFGIASSESLELAVARHHVARRPESSEAHERLGALLLQHNRLREAAAAFKEAVERDPQNTDAAMGLAQVTIRVNETSNVLALAAGVAALDPGAPGAIGAIREAARAFEQALLTRPNDLWLLVHAARCHAKLGNWPQAEQFCRRAERVAPRAMPARLTLGNLMLQQGRREQALAQFELFVKEQPDHAGGREALGRVRWEQGQFREALDEFFKAQQLHPKWQLPYLKAGHVLMHLKDYPGAESQFRKTLELDPASLAAAMSLADSLVAQQKQADAIAVYEKILADVPGEPVASNNLASLLLSRDEQLERAVSLAWRAVEAHPASAFTRDTLGWAYFKTGRVEEAVAQLQEAARLSQHKSGIILYRLGKALWAAEKRSEASDALRRALAAGLPAKETQDARSLLEKR
jgi:tetratricopeptide (TPR) repeat protein